VVASRRHVPALAACLPRQNHVCITTGALFRFHKNKFDEMPCKPNSTENPRSFEKYPTPPQCKTFQWVMSHIWMSHVAHMNRFASGEMVGMLHHSYVWYDIFICVIWHLHMCDTTYLSVCHDQFICVTWLIRTCDVTTSYAWHDSFLHVTGLIPTCDMTQSYACHDSFTCEMVGVPYCLLALPPCGTWLIDMLVMIHWHVWHDSLMCVTWRIHLWNGWDAVSPSSAATSGTWLIDVCDMTH